MNSLFAFCVSLLLVSTVFADHPGHDGMPKFCTKDKTKCEKAGINVTCVVASDKGCAMDVANGEADMALASADDLVKNVDKLKIVYGEKEMNVTANFVKYYGLAVVQKESNITLENLKGAKTCHTGAGKTVGWKIPVGYLLYSKQMPFEENAYKSAADYFSESCVPGVSEKTKDKKVIDILCKLCNGTGTSKCSTDPKKNGYADYEGAFKCMAEGKQDRVGFVKETTWGKVFKENIAKYGNEDDYRLLCKDGKMKALDQYKECNIGERPAYAVVANKDATADMIKKYQAIVDAQSDFSKLKAAGIASKDADKFVAYTKTVKDYVGKYADYYNAVNRKDVVGSATAVHVSFALQVAAIFALVFLV